jgi:uncharacterized protein (DUF2126 family)/transglutaminase-like putative cysteine protease
MNHGLFPDEHSAVGGSWVGASRRTKREIAVSIHVTLRHRTEYRYTRPITLGPQIVRLRPAPHSRTPISAYSLKVEPASHFLNWQQDPQGNFLARLVFPEKTDHLSITVDLVADMAVINPFDFFLEPAAENYPFTYDAVLSEELAPYHKLGPGGPLLAAYVKELRPKEGRTIDTLVELNRRVQADISYVIRMEAGVQTPEETLKLRRGSCRDSSWLLVQILRRLGFAARFVSGYLIQLVADQKPLDGPEGTLVDFTDLHAWCEVYLPGAGWVGFDPTSGLMAGEGHIPLACSPEPQSAAPITGAAEKDDAKFSFTMSVERLAEKPRVTKPYGDAEWHELLALGKKVDAKLNATDVRLTMGGEPTFVAADDPDGAEWNTDAMGPTKRVYAGQLMRRLADRFSPGHMLHYGQGKWYPGEQLPRWALTCYWRKDGQPVWRDKNLLASDEDAVPSLNASDAALFIRTLAERLQVDPGNCVPGYEDAWYYMWREKRLPTNVDPLKSNVNDPLERARLAKVFEQGLDKVVGYALPIARSPAGDQRRWKSGVWFLRSENMFLLPGDSPMGFRLPLDSLPWVKASDYPYLAPTDPMAPRGALPNHMDLQARMASPSARAPIVPGMGPAPQAIRDQRPKPGVSDASVVRTALCVEVRDGILRVFMPPLDDVEDYLELVAAVESVAAERGRSLMLEGYQPPSDPRLKKFSVTPDPGVIEVNIHPTESWDELTDVTTTVYEEARATRLVTEKFMLDGRHVGTGGGNHIVLGGPTAPDSPLLRRPDLLKSLLGYWHNHPSLSYLFSGLFIGPTSQHPRIDEARDDSTYELETAFKALDGAETTPPWLVDRIFRDILVDVTGNTHRTEFCIDKLFSPDSSTGRLGLLELRAFEMPPHARMSLAQQLLLRSLVATFWEKPYTQPLARFGTRLHDDFMLPHFSAQDFADVLEDLKRAGYAFNPVWFHAHHEFRFPQIGHVAYRGIEMELRQALEPWHVLGEDSAPGGTSRAVDSSVERMQVKLNGMVDERHILVCNGRTVPLRATGTKGEYVAGVRYRAWQPPRALHPTLPVDAPLVFDLYDRWSGRSVGGCTYHVSHPGGRNFERFPVNANEAETRRRSRFFPFGHTGGAFTPTPSPAAPEHPLTLDLRRYA